MAVKQEELQPQSQQPAQPEEGQDPASGARQDAVSEAPSPAPTTQDSAGPAADGQPSSLEMNLRPFLEQQVAAAIQPVLNEFRQQMTQAVVQQTARTAAQAPAPLAGERQPLAQAAQQVQAQLPSYEQLTGSADLTRAQPERREPEGPQLLPTGAVRSAVQTIGRQGEHWLQWLLVAGLTAGLTALLTESSHAALQRRADQGLHTLLEKMSAALPDGVINQEMRGKTERTLQTILRESLDAVFAEATRAALQQGGLAAIRGSLNGDSGGALRSVEETLRAMADAIMAVLRRHQQTVIRLLIALALLALASSLGQSDDKKS